MGSLLNSRASRLYTRSLDHPLALARVPLCSAPFAHNLTLLDLAILEAIVGVLLGKKRRTSFLLGPLLYVKEAPKASKKSPRGRRFTYF